MNKDLKSMREARGLSQSELAELTGVTRVHISRLETDQTPNPGMYTMRRIERVIGRVQWYD